MAMVLRAPPNPILTTDQSEILLKAKIKKNFLLSLNLLNIWPCCSFAWRLEMNGFYYRLGSDFFPEFFSVVSPNVLQLTSCYTAGSSWGCKAAGTAELLGWDLTAEMKLKAPSPLASQSSHKSHLDKENTVTCRLRATHESTYFSWSVNQKSRLKPSPPLCQCLCTISHWSGAQSMRL